MRVMLEFYKQQIWEKLSIFRQLIFVEMARFHLFTGNKWHRNHSLSIKTNVREINGNCRLFTVKTLCDSSYERLDVLLVVTWTYDINLNERMVVIIYWDNKLILMSTVQHERFRSIPYWDARMHQSKLALDFSTPQPL